MVKYLAKNDIGQHTPASLKDRMCLLAQQVASIQQDLIQTKSPAGIPCIFQAVHPLNTAPCCYSTRVRLKDSCPTGLVLDTCRSIFFPEPPPAMRAFITATGWNNELKLISNTNVGFSAGSRQKRSANKDKISLRPETFSIFLMNVD